jgi:hypothetical protein
MEPIKLLDRTLPVSFPGFAAREEIMVGYGEVSKRGGVALLRVYAAALGLCTRLGKEAGADYAACKYDLLTYGGTVYGYLRENGVSPKDIATAAVPIILAISEATFPRQQEVDEAAGN